MGHEVPDAVGAQGTGFNDDLLLGATSNDGDVLWTETLDTGEDEEGVAITLGPQGELYVAGHTAGSLRGEAAMEQDNALVMRSCPS
jgi:hypothetical protein